MIGNQKLRELADIDFGDITDEELTASAATVFAMLDAEEDGKAR
jgi:hypothetical protein